MKNKRFLLSVIIGLLIVSMVPMVVFANAAEPPAIVILVNNPPEDLSVVLVSHPDRIDAIVREIAWEGYYAFYSGDLRDETDFVFKITSGSESFEWTPDVALENYNNVFTLDVSKQTITPGKYPLRSLILVSMRVLITLLIEGFIFFLFRFKEKKSWIVFFAVNLVTQGALNILLSGGNALFASYLLIPLVLGEFVVFAVEALAFPLLIKEQNKRRIFAYVFIANTISLIAGGYLISVLPV